MPEVVLDLRMSTPLRILGGCILLLILVLSGCTHVKRGDGPPNYYVDDTKIPNAVPKYEKLSKYGNMPFYNVFGKRYYVLGSSKNYNEDGVASWYGTKFHERRTSSGERYSMLAMTAAHKTLPLPTYVQVTNLSNGKQVIVKVNDRGPFEANRIIDLSYVAAKKLGMLGHGTAKVNVKAIDPRDAQMHPEMMAVKKSLSHQQGRIALASHARHPIADLQAKSVTHVSSGAVYIQVGAFRDRTHAERLKNRLAGLGSPVAVNPGHNSLYRVQIGPFKDIATADRVNKKLQSMGMHTKRVNDDFDIT